MIPMMLDCVRLVSLDIWRVERRDCVWSSWLSRLIPVHPQHSGHVNLFSKRVIRFAALVLLVGASCYRNLFQ